MALPQTLQLWKPAQLLLELLTSADGFGRLFPRSWLLFLGGTLPNPLASWLSVPRLGSCTVLRLITEQAIKQCREQRLTGT